MNVSEEKKDRIQLVIETDRPGKFVGKPHLLDQVKQTISQMTGVEDVRVQVLQSSQVPA
jgi:ribosomal protein S3